MTLADLLALFARTAQLEDDALARAARQLADDDLDALDAIAGAAALTPWTRSQVRPP